MSVYDKNGLILSDVFEVSGESVETAYDINGAVIFRKQTGRNYDTYTISTMFSNAGSNHQAFSIFNGIIAQIIANDKIRLIAMTTGSAIGADISAHVGHGNSCQFSSVYYNPNDEFPLLFSTDTYRRVYVNRITRTSSELLKTYFFDVAQSGYILGIGINDSNDRLFTVGYTYENYNSDMGGENKIHVSVWDLTQETDNGDGTFSIPRISTKIIDWFPCVQGSCYHDGYMFVSSGVFGGLNRVFLINQTTGIIEHTVSMGNNIEPEGCAWVNDEYLVVGESPNNITYKKVEFGSY